MTATKRKGKAGTWGELPPRMRNAVLSVLTTEAFRAHAAATEAATNGAAISSAISRNYFTACVFALRLLRTAARHSPAKLGRRGGGPKKGQKQ